MVCQITNTLHTHNYMYERECGSSAKTHTHTKIQTYCLTHRHIHRLHRVWMYRVYFLSMNYNHHHYLYYFQHQKVRMINNISARKEDNNEKRRANTNNNSNSWQRAASASITTTKAHTLLRITDISTRCLRRSQLRPKKTHDRSRSTAVRRLCS